MSVYMEEISKKKKSVNELQQRVIISLRLTDEGATTPKLVLS